MRWVCRHRSAAGSVPAGPRRRAAAAADESLELGSQRHHWPSSRTTDIQGHSAGAPSSSVPCAHTSPPATRDEVIGRAAREPCLADAGLPDENGSGGTAGLGSLGCGVENCPRAAASDQRIGARQAVQRARTGLLRGPEGAA